MNPETKQENEKTYEAPAVIYDGFVSTRAGSPIGGDPSDIWDD